MRKKLGQHFLKNQSAIKKIVGALDLKSGDVVVEIGPGHGELTEEFGILNLEFRIIAIEKDKKLAGLLQKKFSENKNVEVVGGDALKVLTNLSKFQIPNSKFKLVGNLPYYITGKLLRILSELEDGPSVCVFTLQREVAERICATPPHMNRLAAITQFWAKPEIITHVPREDFSPPPEVDSSVIKMTARNDADSPRKTTLAWQARNDAEKYYKTVKILFRQPRKTILNNLATRDKKQGTRDEIIKKLNEMAISPGDRPQNLGVGEIVKISELVVGG